MLDKFHKTESGEVQNRASSGRKWGTLLGNLCTAFPFDLVRQVNSVSESHNNGIAEREISEGHPRHDTQAACWRGG
eukprot:3026064-Amphidinium_carterae.1